MKLVFPVLGSKPRQSVPWSWVEKFRENAMQNHEQTLERLAERGGLSWCELYAISEGGGLKNAFAISRRMTDEQARFWVLAKIEMSP